MSGPAPAGQQVPSGPSREAPLNSKTPFRGQLALAPTMSGAQSGADGDGELWAHLLGSHNSPTNRAVVLALSVFFVLVCLQILVVCIRFPHSQSVTRLGPRREHRTGEVEMRVWKTREKDD